MRWRDALVIGLLLAGADAAGAQEAFMVKALRTEKVTLYDCNPEKDKRKPQREVARKDFEGGWLATRDPASSLYLKVQVDRTETIEKDQECGAMVAGKQPKTGATRGVGEKCSR